jgi:hypothetical protein
VALPLRGEGEGAVLDEAPLIEEIGDVLAGRALAGLAPPGDGVRAAFVGRRGEALAELGELGANGLFGGGFGLLVFLAQGSSSPSASDRSRSSPNVTGL